MRPYLSPLSRHFPYPVSRNTQSLVSRRPSPWPTSSRGSYRLGSSCGLSSDRRLSKLGCGEGLASMTTDSGRERAHRTTECRCRQLGSMSRVLARRSAQGPCRQHGWSFQWGQSHPALEKHWARRGALSARPSAHWSEVSRATISSPRRNSRKFGTGTEPRQDLSTSEH